MSDDRPYDFSPSDDMIAVQLRPGWKLQLHLQWRPADQLVYEAGGHTFTVRRAAVGHWYSVVFDGEIRSRHRTHGAAIAEVEGMAARMVDAHDRMLAQTVQEASVTRSRRASDLSTATPAPIPLRPRGAATVKMTGKLIATVPQSRPKDINITTAGPGDLRRALAALAQADGAALITATIAFGLAAELAAAPGDYSADIAKLQRQGSEAKARYSELAYPLLITAQRALGAGLPWRDIIRRGAAKGVEGIPDGLITPDFGPRLGDFVLEGLEAVIRHEAQVTYDRDHPEEALARLVAGTP